MAAKHFTISVEGQVQGVSFRVAARSEAERLGVAGSVRNMENGHVSIEAEGEEALLNELVRWCRQGPPLAEVSKVEIAEGEWRGMRDFVIS